MSRSSLASQWGLRGGLPALVATAPLVMTMSPADADTYLRRDPGGDVSQYLPIPNRYRELPGREVFDVRRLTVQHREHRIALSSASVPCADRRARERRTASAAPS